MTIISNEKGLALITTLVVVAILTVVVLEFSNTMRVEVSMSENFRDEVQAYYIAKSGVHAAMAVLREDDNEYDGMDEDWGLLNDNPVVIEEGMTAKVTIRDEEGKLNINYLVDHKDFKSGIFDDLKAEDIFRQLMELQGVASEDIDTIIDSTNDWLDEDDNSRAEGAEESYYKSLDTPYTIGNNLLRTISELRMIKGYTDDILLELGASKNVYNTIDPGSFKYLTIHSNGKINVNTASSELIQSLSDKITIDDAEDIIKHREKEPFTNVTDVNNTVITANDKWNSIKNKIDIKSDYFSIISEGTIILDTNRDSPTTVNKRITAIVKRDKEDENHITVLYWKTE